MSKESVNLSIDSEVLEKAKMQIPNISQFVEECLKQYLGIGNNLIPTSKMYTLIEDISKNQLQLHLMNEREHLEEVKEKTKKQEINLAWRKIYTTYRDTKTIDKNLMNNAMKVLNVSKEELTDILEVCFIFSRQDEIDVTEWAEVYNQYGGD